MVSITGMPSVMQAMTSMPASTDSTMASVANGGGTKISDAFAPISATAWPTELNTGTSLSNISPPRPGTTPATRLAPYSRHLTAWKLPSLPVIPWTSNRVSLPTRMLIVSLLIMAWSASLVDRFVGRATPEAVTEVYFHATRYRASRYWNRMRVPVRWRS